LFAASRSHSKASLGKYNLSGKKDLLSEFGKRVKKIRVEENYLDKFIKEMM
jgi:hypothetical protein